MGPVRLIDWVIDWLSEWVSEFEWVSLSEWVSDLTLILWFSKDALNWPEITVFYIDIYIVTGDFYFI